MPLQNVSMQLAATETHGISQRDLAIMAEILSRYEKNITLVGLFGSRATGRFSQRSDIDVVLFGSITPRDLLRMNTDFKESSIALLVDLCAYAEVDEALQRHIDKVLLVLWSRFGSH